MGKNLAIIPARSGSKGLVDKNIMKLCGKPLLHYTIEAAIGSGCFEQVMVSTDSERYAEVARQGGAEVPFLRCAENASDTAGSWDVVREVLAKYAEAGMEFDHVALLQPTSPLRNSEDIQAAFKKLAERDVENVVSVVEVEHPVQWCFPLQENQSMEEMAKSPFAFTRRQDLETHYIENGAIYIVAAKKIMNADYNFYGDGCYAYIMPRDRSVDIDSAMDAKLVEFMMEEKRQ